MTASNPTPWDGIPDDPDQSGWHWIGHTERMLSCEWDATNQAWGYPFAQFCADELADGLDGYQYLGPCTPPISRCRDGSKKVAVSVRRLFDRDKIAITMSDGWVYHINSYYWHNGAPIFEIIGKTIPEINETAAACRSPNQEDAAE